MDITLSFRRGLFISHKENKKENSSKKFLNRLGKEIGFKMKKKEGEWMQHVVEWLSEKLNIRRKEDWYRISYPDIRKYIHSGGFLREYPLEKMLQEVYPETCWDISKLQFRNGLIKASQRKLAIVLSNLFPDDGWYSKVNRFI